MIIAICFSILLFLVPLILFPTTSEVFEFNKMVLTYAFTVIIVGLWTIKMILRRKIIFRRTILDIPLLIFLGSQILSTLISIDVRTSVFGYYSRFHGGLLSSISYSLLYWAWVSNMDKEKTRKAIKVLLISAIIVSIYGVLEHFGIDKDLWVQDVQSRVFSTLGQPNWLAAWLIALNPLVWVFVLKSKKKVKKLWLIVSALFFLTLLYTKSRSGLLGYVIAYFIFWGLIFWPKLKLKSKKIFKTKKFKLFMTHNLVLFVLILLTGTPWTPSIKKMIGRQTKTGDQQQQQQQQNQKKQQNQEKVDIPALERGGTESSEIRKIVWKGAINIWRNYPILGSGVETFGFAYYNFRPVEHNLVSEWDFIYNKAHNEYLNILATTGILGFTSYSILVAAIFIQIKKGFKKNNHVSSALISGFASILITNSFGFSVVPVALLFFLYPAISVSNFRRQVPDIDLKESINSSEKNQKIIVGIVLCFVLYLLFAVSKYWYVDTLYARASNLVSKNPVKAREILVKVVKLSSKEALYWNKLSNATADIAVLLAEKGEKEKALESAVVAINESLKAESLSPNNVNILRDQSIVFLKLSSLDPNFLAKTEETLKKAIVLAPTDAKFYYNLALTQVRMGRLEEAKETLEYTIEIKSNYVKARFAFGLILDDLGQRQRAISELEYILENLEPDNKLVKQELEDIR